MIGRNRRPRTDGPPSRASPCQSRGPDFSRGPALYRVACTWQRASGALPTAERLRAVPGEELLDAPRRGAGVVRSLGDRQLLAGQLLPMDDRRASAAG